MRNRGKYMEGSIGKRSGWEYRIPKSSFGAHSPEREARLAARRTEWAVCASAKGTERMGKRSGEFADKGAGDKRKREFCKRPGSVKW